MPPTIQERQIQDQQKKIDLLFYIGSCLVFLIVAIVLMSYIQFNPNNPYVSEFDSYYHIKMAEIIQERGIFNVLHNFPWMQFTILRDNYVDHHFLFHILLIPFISIFGPLLGAKIFEVLVVSLAFMFLFIILKELKVKGAFWFALLALFTMSSDFYYRMNFIRDMGLSLLFMTAGIYAIFKNKPIIVGIISFLYVWAYNTFMFIPFFAIAYVVTQLLMGEKLEWKTTVASVAGMTAGIIINPYFPQNMIFLMTHLFDTGFGAKQYTGGEWRPYDTWFWVQINYVPIIIFFTGIGIAFLNHLKQNAKSITLFIVALLFLLLVWKSKRFVEYSPFFLTLAGFAMIKDFWGEKIQEWKSYMTSDSTQHQISQKSVAPFLKKASLVIYITLFIFILALGWGFSQTEIQRARNDTQTLFSMSALMKAHDYLKTNSQEGDIVWTDDWDVFPRYFFANSKNYYLVGLDPEFMNQYDGVPYEGQKGRLYTEWADLSSGRDSQHLDLIKTNYKAKWIIVNTDHPQLYQNLKNRPDLFEEKLFAQNDPSIDDYPAARGDGYYVFKVL